VEPLTRQTLGERRAAVVGYREVSLAGELATGRELPRAAGITSDLPHAVDVVDPAHQELIRSALAVLLDMQEDFELVASVGCGDEVPTGFWPRKSRNAAP
jgi:hypothetical protein